MSETIRQLYLSVFGHGVLGLRMIALGLVVLIAAQSVPLGAFASPSDGGGAAVHHHASMTGDHMGMHHQTGPELTKEADYHDHQSHSFNECNGSVCCGGSCISIGQLRDLRREISSFFSPDVSDFAHAMTQTSLERPPRLFV
ncbi:hypothetical protein [Celeribacter sp.]|uniref:hypothetical protein n=1 Tax=Celeribacter sp. TaxID=1890673 RepID=UPI003A8D7C86